MALTLLQLAALFDASGVLVVVAISVLVLRWFPQPFFRSWTTAYFLAFVVMALELAMALVGEQRWLVALGASALCLNDLWLLRTALLLGGRQLTGTTLGLLWAIGSLGFGGYALLGGSHLNVYLLPAIGLALAFMFLGASVLRNKPILRGSGAPWLGWPLIALGVWLLSYAFVVPTSYAWVGYWISGLLNLWAGVGMLVYLLAAAADELHQSNDELKLLDVLKTNFLNTISHEIRTPLTAIRAATSMMNLADAGERETLMHTVDTNAVQLDRLLEDILDYARLESRTLSFNYEAIDLGDVVVRARDAFAALTAGREIAFEVALQEEPIPVCADAERLVQVITNLLTNALRFTEEGGRIRLWAGVRAGLAVVEVSDTGVGIPAEHLEKVFTRFFQVDGSRTRKVGGTGLGLAIAKAIIEEGHRGRISVASMPRQGSTFTFTLPLAPA